MSNSSLEFSALHVLTSYFSGSYQVGFAAGYYYFFLACASKSYLLIKEEIVLSPEPGWPLDAATTASVWCQGTHLCVCGPKI